MEGGVGGQVDGEDGEVGVFTADGRNLDDEELGSDDDDDDEPPDTDNMVLTQFEKVDRVKQKYKCKFKYGMVQVNGREFCFQECKAEFDF